MLRHNAHLEVASVLVLVTCATHHGSTRSIAERIGERLTEHGNDVEVVEAHEVQQLWQYGAVVAGSAIHNGDWLPEGAEFLHRHATTGVAPVDDPDRALTATIIRTGTARYAWQVDGVRGSQVPL